MKKSLKALGAAGVAAATLVSGLSFGPAAIAVTPAPSPTTSVKSAAGGSAQPIETTGDLKLVKPKGAAKQTRAVSEIPWVMKDADGKYWGFERSGRFGSSAVQYAYFGFTEPTYSDAAARTVKITMGTPGTSRFKIKDVNSPTTETCLHGRTNTDILYGMDNVGAGASGLGCRSNGDYFFFSTASDGTVSEEEFGRKIAIGKYSCSCTFNGRWTPILASKGSPIVGPGFPEDGTEFELTAGATFDTDVTKDVKISGTAANGRTIKISDLSENELASTTARNGSYEVRVPARGSGNQRFYVDEYDGPTQVGEKSVVADYGRAVDITSPANNAAVDEGFAFDLKVDTQNGASLTVKDGNTQLFTRTAGSATETFNVTGLSAGTHELTVTQKSKGNLTTTDKVTVKVENTITNGGIATSGDGYPLTLTEGESKNVAFGVTTTAAISSITDNTFTLKAPTGTKFKSGTTSTTTQYSSDGSTWNNSSYGPATVSVAQDGKTATVSVSTYAGFKIEKGYKLRWGIPLTAITAGTADMTFTGTGTTNNGTFTASGKSAVTVNAAPVSNGGIATSGDGYPLTLTEGESKNVAFGVTTTGKISSISNNTFTLKAPTGTKFTAGTTSTTTQYSADGSTWSNSVNGPADVSVASDGKTATVKVTTKSGFNIEKGYKLRWGIPLDAVTAGNGDMTFSGTGTTNNGTFSASGKSAVIVQADTSKLDKVIVTDIKRHVSETGTTYSYTIKGEPLATVQNGAPGGSWGDIGKLDADGTSTFTTSRGVDNGKYEFRQTLGDRASDKTVIDMSTANVVVEYANGGLKAAGDGYRTTITEGDTKDVRFGVTTFGPVSSFSDSTFTLTAPAGTRFAAGTTSVETESSANGAYWGGTSNVSATASVSDDGATMTVSPSTTSGFGIAEGWKLSWLVPLEAVTPGKGDMTFTGTGKTNNSSFTVAGKSEVTVNADAAQSSAPTEVSAKFESAVTDNATISGKGVTGSTITITSGDTSADVEVVDGKWSYRPAAQGAGDREFTVTQKTGNRPVSDAVKVSLDYGRAVDVTSPADNAELPAGGFDLNVDTQQDAQLVVKDGDEEIATATATGATASIEIPALSADSHELTVSQVSKGNLTTTDKVTVTIGEENTKPGAPTAEGYFPEDVARWASIKGTGTVGATVIAVDGEGKEIGRTTITAADGSYNIPVNPSDVGYGVVSLNVTQSVDGQASDPVAVALDYGQNTPAFTSPTNGDTVANKDLTFTGTGNAGGKVQVNGTDFTDATAIGSSDVTGADDSWSVSNQDLTLQNGPYQLWANQRTKGGKIEFAGINVQVVDAKPAAPTAQGYFPQNVSEWAGVTGTASVGSTVIARDADGNEIGRTEVTDPSGTYNIGINPGKVGYGVVQLTVTQMIGSATSDGVDVDLDYGQNTPQITSPITGATVPNKGLTLTGTGNPGGELEVNGTDFTDATRLGAASLGAGTDWTVSNTDLKLPNGNYQLWANQRTKGGKIEFTGVGVKVAAVKPAAPSAEGYFPQDIAQWAGISGVGAPNATVTATDAAGNVIGETVAGPNGSYNIGINPTKVGYGVVQLTVSQQSDGLASDGIEVDLDYGQNTPAFTTPTDNATVPNKGLNFAGTGNPGGHVQVNGTDMTNATAIGSSAVSGADNTWSVSNDTLTLPVGGPYQLWANQRTKGGKIEFAGINIRTEVAKPAAPTATGNFAENDQQWAWIDGTATKGATVTVKDDQGKEIGSGVVDQNSGYYRIAVDPAKVGMGTVNLTVTQTIDGAESAGVPVSLDYGTAAPIAITSPTNGSTIGGGSQLTISGTGTDGATVSVSGVDPSKPGSAVAFGTPTVTDGTWSVTPTLDLPAGSYQFWAHQFSKGGKYTNSAVNTVITR